MKKHAYFSFDSEHLISPEDLKKESKEIQIEVMKNWFSQNFENPAESTPYISKEGGYIYIWGGPYDAREELNVEFDEVVPEDVIKELVDELECESYEWAGVPEEERYDDYYYDVISANTEFHGTLTESLTNARKLLNYGVSEDLNNTLHMMLHVNIITALETFLSDAFIGTVIENEQLIRKFVKSNTDFSEKKFALNDIFERMDNIEKEVKGYLIDLIWHNLAKVKNLYKQTLEIDFPDKMENLYKGVAKRHDIVHRNGKTKDGEPIIVTNENLIQLLDEVKSFADHIDQAWGVYKI